MSCRLYLVPEDVISTWRSNQRMDQVDKPMETSLSRIDKDMQKVLKDKKMSTYDKEKMYTQKLASFMNGMNQREDTNFVDNEVDVKTKALMNYLEKDNQAGFDSVGQLTVKGKTVPPSSIINLIQDGISFRKGIKRHSKKKTKQTDPVTPYKTNKQTDRVTPSKTSMQTDWATPSTSKAPEIQKVTPYTIKKRARVRSSKVKGRNLVRSWINVKP